MKTVLMELHVFQGQRLTDTQRQFSRPLTAPEASGFARQVSSLARVFRATYVDGHAQQELVLTELEILAPSEPATSLLQRVADGNVEGLGAAARGGGLYTGTLYTIVDLPVDPGIVHVVVGPFPDEAAIATWLNAPPEPEAMQNVRTAIGSCTYEVITLSIESANKAKSWLMNAWK
ncbi:MAG: hypothetical protein Q7R83_00675 [bacterium]|nr:hypothetical protein [bacterium]